MSKGFLKNAYGKQDARKLYDAWASSYDKEVADNGYVTPGRCAAALHAIMPDPNLPILDFGCGTGLSGLAFRLAGFTTIDGLDLSMAMLKQATTKKLYRSLSLIEEGAIPKHKPGEYAAIAAVGVIGAGAAPLSVFDTLMNGLAPGGYLVFSFNDRALEDPENEARVQLYLDAGQAQLLFKEHGDHLPGSDISSNVYVLEKK